MMLKKFEQDKLETKMCKSIILDENYIKSNSISKKEMPINLYEAYKDYHYGIYA